MVFKQIKIDEIFDDLTMSYADIDSKLANNSYQHHYLEGSCCARLGNECSIWYHFSKFKNVKNTHVGVLLLVKFKNKAYQ